MPCRVAVGVTTSLKMLSIPPTSYESLGLSIHVATFTVILLYLIWKGKDAAVIQGLQQEKHKMLLEHTTEAHPEATIYSGDNNYSGDKP